MPLVVLEDRKKISKYYDFNDKLIEINKLILWFQWQVNRNKQIIGTIFQTGS